MHKYTVFVRYLIALTISVLLLPFVGCAAGDPITDRVYFTEISVSSNTSITTRDGTTFGGGGVGVEVDPVYILSDAFHITAAEIATWNGHPALTTGTHGVTGTIVGTSDAQALTNKTILMNNNVPLQWKTFAGAPQDTINLLASNILQITNPSGSVQIRGGAINLNTGVDEEIYLWGSGTGTGRELVLYGNYADAGNTLRDSPTLHMAASYWDGGAAVGWPGTILHDMVTAGATPKSWLRFSINGVDILRLENNAGTVKTYSDGSLDMTTHDIDNAVLDSSVGKGTWTASGTWTLPAFTLGGTVTGGNNNLNNLGHIGYGNTASHTRLALYCSETVTITDDLQRNAAFLVVNGQKTTAPFAGSVIGVQFTAAVAAANNQNWTRNDGVASGLTGCGGGVQTFAGATGTITNASCFESLTANLAAMTITNFHGLHITNPGGGGTVTNNYGVKVDDQTYGSTLDVGIAIAGADTAALWVSSLVDTTDSPNGIMFGASRDTNLYRSAANTLKTDDSFVIGGTLNITAGSLYMSQIASEPSSTANRAGIYAIDLSADNCTIGFFTETAVQATVSAPDRTLPIRINGVTYYLMLSTIP